MDARVGNTVTINGALPAPARVRAGERVRLRLLNAAIARMMALRFEGHRPVIVALDGQPCDPHKPADGRILLGPAMRADVMLDMQGDPGRSYRVVDEFYDRLSYSDAFLLGAFATLLAASCSAPHAVMDAFRRAATPVAEAAPE
jgi:FtsP/CotA-like multicopper oxidase with cupredoxin domain